MATNTSQLRFSCSTISEKSFDEEYEYDWESEGTCDMCYSSARWCCAERCCNKALHVCSLCGAEEFLHCYHWCNTDRPYDYDDDEFILEIFMKDNELYGLDILFQEAIDMYEPLNEYCEIEIDNAEYRNLLRKLTVYEQRNKKLTADYSRAEVLKNERESKRDSVAEQLQKLKRRNQRELEKTRTLSKKSKRNVTHYQERFEQAEMELENQRLYVPLKKIAELGENLFSMPQNFNAMCGVVSETLGSVKNVTDQLGSFLTQFTLPGVNMTDLISFLIVMYKAVTLGDMTLFLLSAANLCRIFSVDFDYLITLVDKVVEKIGFVTEDSADISVYLWTTVIGFVNVLIYGKAVNYSNVVEGFSAFGRASTGWRNVRDMLNWMYAWMNDLYLVASTGKTARQIEMERVYPDLADFYSRSEILLDTPLSLFDRSKDLCLEFIRVYKKWDALRNVAIRERDIEQQKIFQKMTSQMQSRYDSVIKSPAMLVTARKLPVCVFLYGKPGTGKTIFSQILDSQLYKKFGAGQNPSDFVFYRKVENEFWDGYRNQLIVHYDDMLQVKDTAAKPNEEYLEIIRAINEDQHQLHMSAVADKSSTFFDSEFVICTSNCRLPKPVSISDGDAFHRRLHICVEVGVKPEFANANDGLDVDKLNKYAVDNDLENSHLSTHQYTFLLYDSKKGDPIAPKMDYEEFMTYLWTKVDSLRNQNNGLRTELLKMAGIEITTKNQQVLDVQEKLDAIEKTTTNEEFHDSLAEFSQTFVKDKLTDLALAVPEKIDSYVRLFQTTEDGPMSIEHLYDLTQSQVTVDMPENDDILECLENISVVKSARKAMSNYIDRGTRFVKLFVPKAVAAVTSTGLNVLKFLLETWRASMILMPEFVKTIVVNMLVMYGIKKLGRWYNGSCTLSDARTFDEIKSAVPCKKCTFCLKVWNDDKFLSPLGSQKHGIGLLKVMCREAPSPRKYMEIFFHMLDAKNKCESNEESCFRGRARKMAESNELKELRAKMQNMAESNEERTLRAQKKMFAESYPYVFEDKYHTEMSDSVQQEQWASVTCRNAVQIKRNDNGGKMNAFFLCGRILVVPKHFFRPAEDFTGFLLQNPASKEGTMIPLNKCNVFQCKNIDFVSQDCCLVELPRTIPSRPNIISKFMPASKIQRSTEGRLLFCGLRDLQGLPVPNVIQTDTFDIGSASSYCDSFDNRYYAWKSIHYDMDTGPGDCGGLIYSKGSTCMEKILGMHVCGYKGQGSAIVLSQEFLLRNLNEMKAAEENVLDGCVPFAAEIMIDNPDLDLSSLGDLVNLGKLPAPHSSVKSKIAKSAIHGVLSASLMAPAKLSNFVKDGEVVSPLYNGLRKVCGVQPVLDGKILDLACASVAELHKMATRGSRTVRTYEEAVRGVEGTFKGIDRRTSPGYPYCLNNPGSGKHHWFGDAEDYLINEDVRKDVEKLIENCKENKRSDVVYVATLKDERRTLEKVAAGKTRVFEAAPMHYVLAIRMYFMDYITAITSNRVKNEVCVGTNVYSMDWDRIEAKVLSKGKNVIAGDFSNFDGSLHAEVLWKICDMINDWYDDSDENKRVRRVLWEDIVHANVLVKDPITREGRVIRQTHSQPSGNPLTVVINSVFNQIVMRMAYMNCKRRQGLGPEVDFTDHVGFATFGDDNLFGVSDEVVDWFNQETITEALAEYGLTYTDEAKTGKIVKSRKIDEVSFLKRKFNRSGDGYCYALLDFNVILEMMNWIKGRELKLSTEENVKMALTELVLYGENVYNGFVREIRAACVAAGINMTFPSYVELRTVHSVAKGVAW